MIDDRRFLHQHIKPVSIPRKRIVIGFIIGFGFAFALYSLLYMGRESLRIFSMTSQFDLWTMTAGEVWFFNLFIAYISAIFGQSACLGFWFNFPSMRYGKYKRKFTTAVNDQFNLNTFFLSWISKMAVVWAVFFGWTVFEGYYEIPLYPNYIHIFLLVIIVLFFNSWTTILRIYKKRSWKWFSVSFLSVTLLAFALSFVNLVNYKKIDHIILSNNLQYGYGLELPVIDTDRKYHVTDPQGGFIGMAYEEGGSTKLLFRANSPFEKYREVSMSEVMEQITECEGYIPSEVESYPNTGYYTLLADGRVRMAHINRLKKALRSIGIYRLYYSFTPVTFQQNPRYAESALKNVTGAHYSAKFYDDLWQSISEREKVEIRYVSKEKISVNNQLIAYEELKERVLSEVRRISPYNEPQGRYVILFYISDGMCYEDYLNILEACQTAVYEIREEDKPLHIIELTEDMIRN